MPNQREKETGSSEAVESATYRRPARRSRRVRGLLAAALLIAAASFAVDDALQWRPALLLPWAALYIAIGFFANAYRSARWRHSGFFAPPTLITTLGLIAIAWWLHQLHADPTPDVVDGLLHERPPARGHLYASWLLLMTAALLVFDGIDGLIRRYRRRRADRRRRSTEGPSQERPSSHAPAPADPESAPPGRAPTA